MSALCSVPDACRRHCASSGPAVHVSSIVPFEILKARSEVLKKGASPSRLPPQFRRRGTVDRGAVLRVSVSGSVPADRHLSLAATSPTNAPRVALPSSSLLRPQRRNLSALRITAASALAGPRTRPRCRSSRQSPSSTTRARSSAPYVAPALTLMLCNHGREEIRAWN